MDYYSTYLLHYGVKGMRWGHRKRYYNLPNNPRGRRIDYLRPHAMSGPNGRYRSTGNIPRPYSKSGPRVSNNRPFAINETRGRVNLRRRESHIRSLTMRKVSQFASAKAKDLIAKTATVVTGKQYADTYLKANTSFKRIQTSKDFENFAFYATYKNADSNKYMGLFGKNLTSRANAAARAAEKKAAKTGAEEDIAEAKALREKADSTKVYQLSINATKKLKVPSDDNASRIVTDLLRKESFRNDLTQSLEDSKQKMRRPTQQLLFSQAQKALRNEPSRMTKQDRIAVYKAFNLSLTNHNDYEVRAQDAFYGALKKKGYSALLDYNDKEYSSYHAKRPMIVFDLNSVKLQSVAETNPKVVDKMNRKYNADRILKDIPANTIGYITKLGRKTVSECNSYVNEKVDGYLR